VRPHDVRITNGEPSAHKAVGRVRRIARLGAYVKLDLEIATGEVVTVQLTRRKFEEMKLPTATPWSSTSTRPGCSWRDLSYWHIESVTG
jgi:hypothetical protein